MNGRPAYFEPIRQRAAQRWEQLERDPELAGPWHQLFKQVQSPRHILSELLQNADDAGANTASVRIEDNAFVFEHDGEDFKEDHFASLCRFGYSNKRALHTIGFRGIGFKSTFSLGDAVELFTPSLSVVFHQNRFTEPRWQDSPTTPKDITRVRVVIEDDHRRKEVEKNLQEWLKSPVSLLFFKHIRCLRIEGHELRWDSLGPGPVQDSEWMALNEDADDAYLLARSLDLAFPEDALSEIRQERLLGADQIADFPPCKVEIVLGAKGRLYVVLPTGVETELPFACNAPFIQDPARLKIKDPETSPTNRWLLDRVGELAASVMLRWLQQTSLGLIDRAGAYALLPDVNRANQSLEGVCATTVEEAFDRNVDGSDYVLTQAGDLTKYGLSVAVPDELFAIWPEDKVAGYFDRDKRPALSMHVSKAHRAKLKNWGAVASIDKSDILAVLQATSLPKPDSWKQLLVLWIYVAPEMIGYRANLIARKLRIVPVHGKDVLYAAEDLVRLGEKRLLQSDADWSFLASHLLVLNQNWLRFLTEQRRDAEASHDDKWGDDVEAAQGLLKVAGIDEASDVSKVIEQVAASYFKQQPVQIAGCVQLAQIACKLGASVGPSFRFVTKDRHVRPNSHVLVFDPTGNLEALLPETWCLAHSLYPTYATQSESCSLEEWTNWIGAGRAGLSNFAPITMQRRPLYGRSNILAELARRSSTVTPYFPYVGNSYVIEDWDFTEDLWRHWQALSESDELVWGKLMAHVLDQTEAFWNKAKSARALQVATTGNTRAITNDPLLPDWIIKFRELPCLPDTRGFYRKPADLLRRTPETESLMDVEPFIHGRFDTESTRPLLDLLGVRNLPTGPERLLDRLRALSKAESPPIHEVEKWYRRLDQMADACSTEVFANIKKALREENIVLTSESLWAAGAGVFLSSDDEDVPGAAVIRESVSDLTLWRKIGIAERPTVDLAIQWLKLLPCGSALPPDDLRRAKALLARHPARIWHECGCWLNLANEWVPTDRLRYALTMRTLVTWSHLHQWVKQTTADFQRLPAEFTESPPFSDITTLASRIEDSFDSEQIVLGCADHKPWTRQLGIELSRLMLDDEDEQHRIRDLGADLAASQWQEVRTLEIIPYIDGKPAGTSKVVDVVWADRVIYVRNLPAARLARLVPDRLGKVFVRQEVAAALSYCFGRTATDVTEYMEENFQLAEVDQKPEPIVDQPTEVALPPENHPTSGAATPTEPAEEPIDGVDGIPGEAIPETPVGPDASTVPEDFPPEPEPPAPPAPKPRPHPKPEKPSIIERFAQNLGYKRSGEDRYIHADGSWLAKSAGEIFPWTRGNPAGEIICHYWIKDHCLELEPLQVDAAIWGMVEKYPHNYALLLANAQGKATEIRGEQLNAMREAGHLKLHPATYRLVYENEHEQ
jgi:hypothetical protein